MIEVEDRDANLFRADYETQGLIDGELVLQFNFENLDHCLQSFKQDKVLLDSIESAASLTLFTRV